MKNKHDRLWWCGLCPTEGTTTSCIHEILFTAKMKKVCEEYNVQMPLCLEHHHRRHHDRTVTKEQKKQMDIVMCDLIGLDYYKALQSIDPSGNRGYLERHKDGCEKAINAMEV